MFPSGLFIVVEGPDGSGTTKHANLLAQHFRDAGAEVIVTQEPTEGEIGQDIRQILESGKLPPPDAMQLLFCADRAQHVKEVILPALSEGKTVICDRYTLSTIVYGTVMGLDSEWLKDVNKQFPKPDLTVITLPPYDICTERIGKRVSIDYFEQEEFRKRVYQEYQSAEDLATIVIDTSGEKKNVAEGLWSQVQEFFGPLSREAIQKLS